MRRIGERARTSRRLRHGGPVWPLLAVFALSLPAAAAERHGLGKPEGVTRTAMPFEMPVSTAAFAAGDLQFAFAERLEGEGDPYKALLEYERYLHFFSDGTRVADARLRSGWCWYTGRKWSLALAQFRDLARDLPRGPRRAESQRGQAFCHLQLFSPRAARDALRAALEDADELPERTRLLIGWTFVEEWDWEGAENELAALKTSDRADVELLDPLLTDIRRIRHASPKHPAVGFALSALVPGLGQAYAGRMSDAIFTAVVTDLFIGLAAFTLVRGDRTGGAILASFATLFYLGNVVGGYNAPILANERAPRALVDRWRARVLVPPGLSSAP